MSTAISHDKPPSTMRSRIAKGETADPGESSTPVPDDAPASTHVLSLARKQVRANRRLFYSIDYVPRVSYLDPKSDYRNFRGFFNLFWIGLFIMVVTTAIRNIKDTGNALRTTPWRVLMANIWSLAASDFAMVASTALVLPFHKLYRKGGIFRWAQRGRIWQSVFEMGWLVLWVNWPFMLEWTWTAQVFFMLHTITFLMKMHSYAFYTGHLCEIERRLLALDKPDSSSVSKDAVEPYPETSGGISEKDRPRDGVKTDPVAQLREDLATELTSPLGHVTYPENLTLANYLDYIFCPTLCYELEYPRSEVRRWSEVAVKGLAVFGCIFLLTLLSGEFIVPVLFDAHDELQAAVSTSEKLLIFAETISMLLFPFMIAILLVFLVIFEYILGAFAEITRFADRQFYSDWWNSCDWLEFSSEWNIPVHHFLRRHVYYPIKANYSKTAAMSITFFISAIGHELVMSCITHKMRGYGFLAMMSQLPIVTVQKSRVFRGQRTMNNVFFWCSMILGLALMCALYVLV